MAKNAAKVELPILRDDDFNSQERLPVTPSERRMRARTISIRRLSKAELEQGRAQYPEEAYWRPDVRSACADVPRPCPYVSCKHHLYLDVHPERGSIKLNFPHLEVWELEESCALDVADRGGVTLEEVGNIMNLTRERVRQVETVGLARVRSEASGSPLEDYADDDASDDDYDPSLYLG